MARERFIDIYQNPNRDASPKELARIDAKNREHRKLYLAVRQILNEQFDFDCLTEEERAQGKSPVAGRIIPPDPKDFPADESILNKELKCAFASIYGMMNADNFIDPSLGRYGEANGKDILIKDPPELDGPDSSEVIGVIEEASFRADRRFVEKVVDCVKEFNANRELYCTVLDVVIDESSHVVTTHDGNEKEIKSSQVAEIGRRLLMQRDISPEDPQIERIIKDMISQALTGALQNRSSLIDIQLPDLELDDGYSVDIIPDNVKALSAVYYAAMFEEMRFFMVADKIAEQFMNGMLPIQRGSGGENIYRYIRSSVNRFTESDRRGLYARAFGLAQGSVEVEIPNREFQDLWIRFLAAVSLTGRQVVTEKQLVHSQQVHKIGRDLSVNLSLHGYSVSYFFAVELQKLVRDVFEMLGHADVIGAFGVRNLWQLIERITQMYFGTSVNTLRFRTMAQSGSKIILWLAEHAPVLASPFVSTSPLFNKKNPEFGPLQDYVERWLAVTGTPDSTVEQLSEPIAATEQATIPRLHFGNMPDIQSVMEQAGQIAVPTQPAM